MLDVTTALAVARRQGVHLQAMQELQNSLRTQLLAAATPPSAAFELQAVAQLALLLRHGRQHEVEEIAETLLTLPGRAPLWWLTVGLARWDRGRPERAVEALQAALAGEPNLPAARFLLGQCHRALGDIEAALHDFALLDPVPGERPAQPSLLTAYADELLGTQAPWEAREFAFERVRLLREGGRLVEALAVITGLLRREPAAADALLAQGILFAELQQPAAALLVLDQALAALRPEERLLADEDPLATVQAHRAVVLFALGDKEGAAAARSAAQRLGAEPAVPPNEQVSEPGAHDNAAAAYAELRSIAQQTLLDHSVAALPADAAPETGEAAVVRDALREQMAGLLFAALRALDTHADAAACRALIERAQRDFQALGQLAPALAAAPAVRQLVAATARVLGVAELSADRS
jgi:tetratricopeptide (TPR) repeat protein